MSDRMIAHTLERHVTANDIQSKAGGYQPISAQTGTPLTVRGRVQQIALRTAVVLAPAAVTQASTALKTPQRKSSSS